MKCYDFARVGDLDGLKRIHEHGCPLNDQACALAAKGGHLECLKYLHEHYLAVRTCRHDPCSLRPRHPDLVALFADNSTEGEAARARVLGRLALDRGYIDGVRWGPDRALVREDERG